MYRNNVLVGTKTSTPFTFSWDTTHEENGQYSLQSKAYDASGNMGTSPLITVDVENNDPDTIAPAVSITSPLDQDTVSGTLDVVVSASDNFGVSRVDMYRNNVLVGTKTSAPFTFSWDTTQEENGQYSLQSKAYDASGNVGTSPLITVDVENSDPDTIAPAVSITSPLDQGTVPRKSTVTITASADDNTGVTKVEFYVNGVLECTDTTDSYTCSWKVVAKPNVTYRLQAMAYDANGNVGSSAPIEVTSK